MCRGRTRQFDSARLNSVFAFPLSGRAPFVLTWEDFTSYFDKMTRTGVVKSMKDFYWDIRPKPEFGTIEIRVFDTPLTIERAAALAGLRAVAGAWFLAEQPFMPEEDDYLVYTYNRFQACRFGWTRCTWTRPRASTCRCASTWCMTMDRIAGHAATHGATARCTCCAARPGRPERCPLAARAPAPGAAAGRGQPPGRAALSGRRLSPQAIQRTMRTHG
jgi:carboxylate-amine ligase